MPEATADKLRITIHVYDTDLTVFVPREDEEHYRKGAKLITDVVNSYSGHFRGKKSEKEILYMALIDIALRYQKETVKHDAIPFLDVMTKLTSEIEEVLK